MAGIYIHIPFCKQACYYCDFHFSTNTARQEEMVQALCREIELQRHYLETETIQTVYFGGGTPSLLSARQLDIILHQLHEYFILMPDAEITLEANPDDLTFEKLKSLRQSGINRLSLGIQTFHNRYLQFLNRAHDRQRATDAFRFARDAGFNNISIDLIYAIPGETTEEWEEDIEQALQLKPEHISSYSLTIEEKTVFGRWTAHGKLKPEPDDTAATQLEMLMSKLAAAGYEQYEISNFALPGFYSRHNSSYWQQQPYLGIGPGAHSYNMVCRQFNVRNNHQYIRSIQQGIIPAETEVLTPEHKINEYLLTTLRTQWGANLQLIKNDYGYDVVSIHQNYIHALLEERMAYIESNHMILTRSGKLLADKIASDLFK